MDMMFHLPVQPAAKAAPAAKTPLKSAQSGADGQGKSFDDVLKQSAESAAEELPVEELPAVDEDAADETGQKAIVASVLIGLLPEVQLEAESAPDDAPKAQTPQEVSTVKSAFSAAIAQLVEQKKADIQKQLEEIEETGITQAQKFAQMAATTKPLEGEKDAPANLDVLDLRQTAQQRQSAAQQRNLAELLPTGEAGEAQAQAQAQKEQGLLQMLNAKGAANAALLTEAQAQAAQNQAQAAQNQMQAAQNQAQPEAKAPVLSAEQPKLELPVTQQEAPAVHPQQAPLEKAETAALAQNAAANPAEKSAARAARPVVTEETPENAAVNAALKHSAAKSFDSESAPQGEQQSMGDSKASQTAALTQTAAVAESSAKSEPAPSFGQVFSGVSAQQPLAQQSASTEAAAEPKAAQQLAKFDVPGQIVEQARLIRTDEDTQMVIKLKPEHLGELTLRVRVENGVVNASFHSENAQVRSLLEASIFQLKQDLAGQGIKVDNVGVYAGMGQQQFDQGQAGRDQQPGRSKGRRLRMADAEEEAEALKSVNQAASEDGVDYLI